MKSMALSIFIPLQSFNIYDITEAQYKNLISYSIPKITGEKLIIYDYNMK